MPVAFVLRRILDLAPTLLVVTILVFSMVRLIPGDPVLAIAGPDSSPEAMAQIRENLGLNRPLHLQYWDYLRGLLSGDMGESIRTQQPVIEEIGKRLPATLEIAVGGLVVSLVFGISLGIAAALRPGTVTDVAARIVSLFGVSSPTFFTGLLFVLAFGYYLRIFPVSGRGGLDHLVLPAVTVALTSVAFIARLTRSSLLEVLSQDYVRTARAKGLPGARVVIKHALRNGLMGPITVAGLEFGRLLSGVIVIEIIFSWPGTGRLLINAIQFRDFPIIQGLVLTYALIYMFVNVGVDLLYAVIDPRITLA